MTIKDKLHIVSIALISLVFFTLLMINSGCEKHNIKWDLDRVNQNDSVNFAPNGSPLVNTTNISSITQSSAIISGEIISLGNSTITQHGHCWSNSSNPTTSNSKTTLGAISNTGNFSSNLSGLNSNSTYYVRAYATNSSGTAYGNQVSFTTLGLWSSIGQLSGITYNNNAMVVLSSNNVWVVGDNVWNWDGNNWNTIVSPNNLNLKAVHGTSSNNIWVIDSNNGIWNWNGASWNQCQTCGFLGSFNDILVFGNSVVIGGTENFGPGLCISTNNGTRWFQEDPSCTSIGCHGFVDMDGTSMNNIWVGAGSSTNNGVQGTVVFNGVSWSSNENMYNIQCLSTLSSSVAFATSAPYAGFWYPTIWKYNGGWTQITNPTGMGSNSGYTPIDAVSSNEIWFGSDKIYNYNGVSWTEETGSISNNIKIIQMLNNNEGFAISGNGTILKR